MRKRITDDLIKGIKPGEQYDVWDDKLPGLVLRIRRSGRATWMVSLGRNKMITLGRADVFTPEAARKEARGTIGSHSKGVDVVAARRRARASTLREFLDGDYGKWQVANFKGGAATVNRIKGAFPSLLDKRLTEINSFAVERWRTARRKAGRTQATCNREIGALRGVFTMAQEWKILPPGVHPLKAVKAARLDVIGRIRYLSVEEEAQLRRALDARETRQRNARANHNSWLLERHREPVGDLPPDGVTDFLKPLVLLLMNTGLRRGEALQLRWRDVDLPRAQLVVRGDGAKSGRTRHIPLNAEAVAVLKVWQPEDADGDAPVFPARDGDPARGFRKAWLNLAKAAKIPDVHVHDLRHHFASKLVMAGVDLNTVRELLGHADIKMTLRYGHLAPEHKAAAVARLAR